MSGESDVLTMARQRCGHHHDRCVDNICRACPAAQHAGRLADIKADRVDAAACQGSR
jgi:hypothetical protein